VTQGRPVVIRSAVRTAILAHARRARPAECCGLLLGARNQVAFAVPMINASRSPTRFRIDPAAHIELRRVVRAFAPALAIVGVYHSHPAGEAEPSPADVSEAFYPEWAYLVIGLVGRGPRIRAYRLVRGRARRLPIRWRARLAGL
jgi:proteasome lid subunit RPN8/RPN11